MFLGVSKEEINDYLKSFNKLIMSEEYNLFVLDKFLDRE